MSQVSDPVLSAQFQVEIPVINGVEQGYAILHSQRLGLYDAMTKYYDQLANGTDEKDDNARFEAMISLSKIEMEFIGAAGRRGAADQVIELWEQDPASGMGDALNSVMSEIQKRSQAYKDILSKERDRKASLEAELQQNLTFEINSPSDVNQQFWEYTLQEIQTFDGQVTDLIKTSVDTLKGAGSDQEARRSAGHSVMSSYIQRKPEWFQKDGILFRAEKVLSNHSGTTMSLDEARTQQLKIRERLETFVRSVAGSSGDSDSAWTDCVENLEGMVRNDGPSAAPSTAPGSVPSE